MKKAIFILSALICAGQLSAAPAGNTVEAGGVEKSDSTVKNVVPDVSVVYYQMEHSGKYMNVEMNVDLSELKVRSNRAVLLIPRLVNGTDSLDLPSIGIYGRDRYYIYTRNGISTLSNERELSFKAKDKPGSLSYSNLVSYLDWINGASLKLYRSDWGCCKTKLAEYEGLLGQHNEKFFPELVYVTPKAEMDKIRFLSGSAFIDFPVDQTVIYPDYRRNTAELGKVHASIDSVRNDSDVTITGVWLKGFASPESPYKHNTELAIGRTATLAREHEKDGSAHVYTDIDRLYYGFLENVQLGDEYHFTMPLMKNTNNLRIILQHLSGEPVPEDMFTYSIIDDNGSLDWDNSVLPDETITYHAWHVGSGTAVTDPEPPVQDNATKVQSAFSTALAEFTVSRLMADHAPETRLVVRRAEDGEEIININLIDALLLVKEYYNRNMSDQEYLDRNDEYSLTFFLDEGFRWMNAYIYINSWRVVLQNTSL